MPEATTFTFVDDAPLGITLCEQRGGTRVCVEGIAEDSQAAKMR